MMKKAGSNVNEWQKRHKTLIINLLEDTEFSKRLSNIKSTDEDANMLLTELFIDFKVPTEEFAFFENYLKTGQEDYSLILTPASVISTKHRTVEPTSDPKRMYAIYKRTTEFSDHLYLSLSKNMTKQELKSFIDTYWDELIAPKLKGLGHPMLGNHIRPRPVTKRNNRIQQLADTGLNDKAIAKIINDEYPNAKRDYTNDDIRQIRHQIKSKN